MINNLEKSVFKAIAEPEATLPNRNLNFSYFDRNSPFNRNSPYYTLFKKETADLAGETNEALGALTPPPEIVVPTPNNRFANR